MAKRTTGSKKRRTREHVIADLAVNYVERAVLKCGWTLHRIVHDYGLDACLTTYNSRGEVENGVVWMQVKATDQVQRLKQSPAIALRVARKDVLSWIGELYPVVLVVYDAATEQAYWYHVQAELRGGKVFEMARSGATLTMQIPLAQVIDELAIREFQLLKAQCVAQW